VDGHFFNFGGDLFIYPPKLVPTKIITLKVYNLLALFNLITILVR